MKVNQLTDSEEKELYKQIDKGQSLQMLCYVFKFKKHFIKKFAKLKGLVLRKEHEVDYIRDLTLAHKQTYINGLLKR